MWIKGKFILLRIKVPTLPLPPFIVPVFALTGILECLEDLLALGALVAPGARIGKKLTTKEARDLAGVSQSFLYKLGYMSGQDLVNVHLGKDKIHVLIKVI